MAEAKRAIERPLSPHLGIYRLTINMVMSIVHRMTGAALYLGTALLAWWLVALAIGPKYFAFVNGIFGSIPGKIVLFGYTWALMHHMLGGIRHLIWDTGRGFDLRSSNGQHPVVADDYRIGDADGRDLGHRHRDARRTLIWRF